jgi:hypothetical protein
MLYIAHRTNGDRRRDGNTPWRSRPHDEAELDPGLSPAQSEPRRSSVSTMYGKDPTAIRAELVLRQPGEVGDRRDGWCAGRQQPT